MMITEEHLLLACDDCDRAEIGSGNGRRGLTIHACACLRAGQRDRIHSPPRGDDYLDVLEREGLISLLLSPGCTADLVRRLLAGRIKVGKCVWIGKDATIGDGASLEDWSQVGVRAFLGAHATVGAHARICDDAAIGHRAHVGAHATVASWVRLADRESLPAGKILIAHGQIV